MIQGAFRERELSSGVVSSISEAKGTVLSHTLDRAGVKSSIPSIDPSGYLTEMSQIPTYTEEEVSDLKKARMLLKSLVSTNPENAASWLAYARLEEKDGNLAQARKILEEGCMNCPDSEDLWIEAARLENPISRKAILAKAAAALPNSTKIWLAAASRETIKRDKLAVLRKGLELNPDSVKLWKELVSLADASEAKMYLKKAVTCVPHSLDLWLALARLEDYDNAKAVLNSARKKMPHEPAIWINAAKLEESQGEGAQVGTLISRGIKLLTQKGVKIDRAYWFSEALIAEHSSNIETCKAIIQSTLHIGLEDHEKISIWLANVEEAKKQNCFESARAILDGAIGFSPSNIELWNTAISLEESLGNTSRLMMLRKNAFTACPSNVEFWEKSAALELQQGNPQAAREIYSQARHSCADLRLFINSANLEIYLSNPQAAQEIMHSARNLDDPKAWISSALIEVQISGIDSAKNLLEEGIERYPNSHKIYIHLAKLLKQQNRLTEAQETLEKARRLCRSENKVWIESGLLEESMGNDIKARYLLEKGRQEAQHPLLWAEAVEFEMRKKNVKAAKTILSRGLQNFPESGELWALEIKLSDPKQKMTRTSNALEKCKDSPYVLLEAAKIFFEIGKVHKARAWFENALKQCSWMGDIWIYYYRMEKMLNEECNLESLSSRLQFQEISSGRLWKSIKRTGMSNLEVVETACTLIK